MAACSVNAKNLKLPGSDPNRFKKLKHSPNPQVCIYLIHPAAVDLFLCMTAGIVSHLA